MARYVMANRRAGKFGAAAQMMSRATFEATLDGPALSGSEVLQVNRPQRETGRITAVIETEAAEIEARRAEFPEDVLIEPEILHYRDESLLTAEYLGCQTDTLDAPAATGATAEFSVHARAVTGPLEQATVTLFVEAFGITRRLTGTTDSSGKYVFTYSTFFTPAVLVVVPYADYWPMVFQGPTQPFVATCPPLPTADKRTGWWHRESGIRTVSDTRGSGIRVGVVDTGVGIHPALAHVKDIGAFVDGMNDPHAGADTDRHGTHVIGTIGARANQHHEFSGIAPGASVYSARVFPPASGANQLAIAAAIDALSSDYQTDLINLSLGAKQASAIERDAIQDARERGCLCICAAGNSNGPVEYPAAFPETIAVSALGLRGWGPAGSMSAMRLPHERARYGNYNLYHANFSCHGGVDVAAGGVGIISTVPAHDGALYPYAAMGGTSMASPVACGCLAATLSTRCDYQSMSRDEMRAALAEEILRGSAKSVGLSVAYEGHGVAQAR